MTSRRTIGENPLDALVPPPKARGKTKARTKTPVLEAPTKPQETRREAKERLTVHLSPVVINRAKDAVYWSPGLTLAGLAETAFVWAVERLEKENGRPFPPRKGELRVGRPVKWPPR